MYVITIELLKLLNVGLYAQKLQLEKSVLNSIHLRSQQNPLKLCLVLGTNDGFIRVTFDSETLKSH